MEQPILIRQESLSPRTYLDQQITSNPNLQFENGPDNNLQKSEQDLENILES